MKIFQPSCARPMNGTIAVLLAIAIAIAAWIGGCIEQVDNEINTQPKGVYHQ